jgi:PKD repeat protein
MLSRAKPTFEIGGMVRSLDVRRATLVSGLCSLAAAIALLAGAVPAGAVVANIGGHGYGVTPIDEAAESRLVAAYRAQHGAGLSVGPLAHRYDVGPSGGGQLFNAEGGPVMHSVTTHVIYWDPNKEFTSTTKGIVDGFFVNVAHDSGLPTNVFAIAGQYTDSTGHAAYSSTSSASQTDTQAYPTSECTAPNTVFSDPGPYSECMLDEQLQEELTRFIDEQNLPVGPSQLYFLLLPHKVATCFDEEEEGEQVCSNNFFCAYHSSIEPGTPDEIIYADIPFSLLDSGDAKGCQDDGRASIQQPNPDNAGGKDTETRFADVALKYISHEYMEADTDPLVGEETAWVDAHGLEVGDKCNGVDGPSDGIGKDPNSFLPELGGAEGARFNQSINTGSYYLQSEWDNGGKACLMKPVALGAASFSSASATAGSSVSFNGSSSDPYGGFDPSWTFGDGGTATGASPSHTFATAGDYTVTMTPRDALTDSTGPSTSRTVTVTPPAASRFVRISPPPASTAVVILQPPPASSVFTAAGSSFNAKTGVITIKERVSDPGRFSWQAAFANGKFGAFASASNCRAGFVRLAGRCRPAKVVFAKGSESVVGAGTVTIALQPSASAVKALKNARRKGKALLVSGTLSFQSSRGASRVSRPLGILVKLRK